MTGPGTHFYLRHNAQVLVTLVKEAELESMGIPNMIPVYVVSHV